MMIIIKSCNHDTDSQDINNFECDQDRSIMVKPDIDNRPRWYKTTSRWILFFNQHGKYILSLRLDTTTNKD